MTKCYLSQPRCSKSSLMSFIHFPSYRNQTRSHILNLPSYSVSKNGEARTTTILNEAIKNDARCTSVGRSAEQKENSEANVTCPICNKKCRVSLIETHADICLRRENNEFTVIPDIIIS